MSALPLTEIQRYLALNDLTSQEFIATHPGSFPLTIHGKSLGTNLWSSLNSQVTGNVWVYFIHAAGVVCQLESSASSLVAQSKKLSLEGSTVHRECTRMFPFSPPLCTLIHHQPGIKQLRPTTLLTLSCPVDATWLGNMCPLH